MQQAELATIVAQFAGGLPRQIGKQLEDVEVLVCENPELAHKEINEVIEDPEPLPADCKGIFIGEPLETEESDEEEGMVTESLPDGLIVIIASNIANEEEAVLVLLHEIGHALGMDEQEVTALGLGVQQAQAPPAPEGAPDVVPVREPAS